MCLKDKVAVEIPQVDAWKVFSIISGKLYSCFQNNYYHEYKKNIVNTHILNSTGTEGFYSFKNRESCEKLLEKEYMWDLTAHKKIILPVILYDVIYSGIFTDYNCLFGEHNAYISKKILVKQE